MNIDPSSLKTAELAHLMTLAGHLDVPKYGPEYLTKNTIQCTCGKIRTITPDMFFFTGLVLNDGTKVAAIEHLCSDCASAYAGTAKLICLKCRPRRVIARIAPNRDPKTGLEFRADRCYHASGCPACEPSGKSFMLEQAVLLRKQMK